MYNGYLDIQGWRIFAWRMSVAKTETGSLPSRFTNLFDKWLTRIMTPTSTQMYTGNTNCSHVLKFAINELNLG